MVSVYVTRQPIYSASLDVFGYELLCRINDLPEPDPGLSGQAISTVFINAFLEIGLKRIVNEKVAFIKIDRHFLLGKHPLPFLKDNVALEILPQGAIDQELQNGINELAKKHYTLVLESNEFGQNTSASYLKNFQIAKVCIGSNNQLNIKRLVWDLRRYPVKLLAYKIETREDFDFCKQLGFNYFQGTFLSRPNIIKGRRLPARRIAVLELLSRLYDPDVTIKELEDLLKQDVSMSYKLLRMINSAYYGVGNEVDSIRQALVLLGLNQLRAWLCLLSLMAVDDQPSALTTVAMIRGKMCELLAHALREKPEERYFTVGLLSMLDVLMEQSMEDILVDLPLVEELKEALLNKTGTIGQVLTCVLAYENGQWDQVNLPGLRQAQIREAYLQSIAWASEINRKINL